MKHTYGEFVSQAEKEIIIRIEETIIKIEEDRRRSIFPRWIKHGQNSNRRKKNILKKKGIN